MIIAAASLVLISLLLRSVLLVAFIPLNANMISDLLSTFAAFLIASLIVGYVFALKIQEESRSKAIGSILVLSMVASLFFTAIWISNPFESPWFKDSLNSLFNANGWTNYDWAAYSAFGVTAIVAIMLVSSLIGLYFGSMRKNSKE